MRVFGADSKPRPQGEPLDLYWAVKQALAAAEGVLEMPTRRCGCGTVLRLANRKAGQCERCKRIPVVAPPPHLEQDALHPARRKCGHESCGVLFMPRAGGRPKRYCSKQCAAQAGYNRRKRAMSWRGF